MSVWETTKLELNHSHHINQRTKVTFYKLQALLEAEAEDSSNDEWKYLRLTDKGEAER